MPLANFDIQLQADDRLLQISWAPCYKQALIGDITSGWKEIGGNSKIGICFWACPNGRELTFEIWALQMKSICVM